VSVTEPKISVVPVPEIAEPIWTTSRFTLPVELAYTELRHEPVHAPATLGGGGAEHESNSAPTASRSETIHYGSFSDAQSSRPAVT
jgi:hypothetical protein